jgi:acyl transferase domain-containing protein
VSSFGLSGTNAHALLEEAPPAALRSPGAGPFLFAVSARSAAGLAVQCGALAAWLRGPGAAARPDDVARTLAEGRTGFDHRAAFLAPDNAAAAAVLETLARGETPPGAALGQVRRDAAPAGMARTAAAFVAGAALDAVALFPQAVRTLRLPPTRFEREVHWGVVQAEPHPLLDAVAGGGETVKTFGMGDALVCDHVIGGVHLLHAGVFLEMARLAAERAGLGVVTGLVDVTWRLRRMGCAAYCWTARHGLMHGRVRRLRRAWRWGRTRGRC